MCIIKGILLNIQYTIYIYIQYIYIQCTCIGLANRFDCNFSKPLCQGSPYICKCNVEGNNSFTQWEFSTGLCEDSTDIISIPEFQPCDNIATCGIFFSASSQNSSFCQMTILSIFATPASVDMLNGLMVKCIDGTHSDIPIGNITLKIAGK